MSGHQSAFPFWVNGGKTFMFTILLTNIPNLEDKVDDIVEDIRVNSRVEKVQITSEGLLRVGLVKSKNKREKLYNAIFLNTSVKEIAYFPRGSPDSELVYWICKAIRQNNLQKLRLDYQEYTSSSEMTQVSKALRCNRSLKELQLSCRQSNVDTIMDDLAKALRVRSPLTCVKLWCEAPRSLRDCAPVLGALGRNMTVRILELTGHFNSLAQDCTTHMLQENMGLENLQITNQSSASNATDIGPILRSLNGNKSLKILRFTNFRIGTYDYRDLGNRTLTALSFVSIRNVDMEGARSFGGALAGLTALNWAKFTRCALNDDMVGCICKGLEKSKSMETFGLCQSSIGDDSCMHIVKALERNEVVSTLDLLGNRAITDTGVKAIIECVKSHPSITSVDIRGTGVSGSVKDELEYYLDLNKGPKSSLCASPPLPLSLWPHAFERADDFRWTDIGSKPPDVLYYLVKAKADLFAGVKVTSQGRKRRRRN